MAPIFAPSKDLRPSRAAYRSYRRLSAAITRCNAASAPPGYSCRSNAICATILRPTNPRCATISVAICAAVPVTSRSLPQHSTPPRDCARHASMFDLGTSFLASVERDPRALAIVDGDVRFTYADWYRRISGVADALNALGLRSGDHLLTVLQNCWQAATVHWACQFTGVILTPVNWRSTATEIDYLVENSEAKVVVYDAIAAASVAESAKAQNCARIALEAPKSGETAWAALVERNTPDATPHAKTDAWSIMLYTSGTTAQPKGVPRRHNAERAAALAHVAQNMYAKGERTLGVMPLYHTMGVRSVRKLGLGGASMTDGLLKELQTAFKPELFGNHYGSSEIYTFTIDQNAPAKPGSAGRAGINQRVRVAKLGATSPSQIAAAGEEGEVIAQLLSDEAFEGYWRRPEADAKAIRDGWYFTGDAGYLDADGDLFVTGRLDDMIISGGENVSPVEIESCLSLHPAVSEVAVVGLPDERWGKVIAAFVKRRKSVEQAELDEFCQTSGLAKFKRPRRYIFVENIPKSPVGKLLRRKLVAGEYTAEEDPSLHNGNAA